MVGLRSGGTSLLFPWVGGSALRCHPDRSNPIFSSHLTSREMVGLRSGGTSLLLPRLAARTPMPTYVLTSKQTFSGAEEFSYNLKNLKRATIIIETTGGRAHPVSR